MRGTISLLVNDSFIQEVSAIINVATTGTYGLYGQITYSSGSIISRSKSNITAAVSSSITQTSVTNCVIQSANGLIQVGMQISGNGINQPCYVLSYGGSTTVTLTTTQTIAANTTLTFNYNNAGSKLSAVRIA